LRLITVISFAVIVFVFLLEELIIGALAKNGAGEGIRALANEKTLTLPVSHASLFVIF
jgi:hypothetical protein